MRALCLAVPVGVLAVAAWRTRPDRRARGAALLAFIGTAIGIAALHTVAERAGWWAIAEVPGSALGLPVDLWLGWAVLWGPLAVLIRAPLPITMLALLWLDVLALPRLAPLLRLGPLWLIGEISGLLLVAVPAILVGRWCADQRRLPARASLQMAIFAALIVWFGPSLAIDQGGGSWQYLLHLETWQLSLAAQLVALVAVPGVLALREFVERGGGTPYPWDPPVRLVTTGPYAYVANPMQCSGVALTLLMAAFVHSPALAAGGVLAVVFSVAVAGPQEHDDLSSRHGAAWAGYRRAVRVWLPRWRPYVAAPARLHLAVTCDVCSSAAGAMGRLGPVGLEFCPAELQGAALRRARYDGPDGYHADGVAALARGLDHVNLGWAFVGWILRTPVLDRLAQVIVDGLGGAPRTLAEGAGWPTPDRS